MTIVEKIKLALRINHDALDTDIEDTIATARADMIRSGISSDIASSELDIVEMAIKTYCRFVYASDDKMADGYFQSWQYQLDNLRKSTITLPKEED